MNNEPEIVWQGDREPIAYLRAVPEGFNIVTVIVTEKEYKELRRESSFLGSGTLGEALRKRANMPSMPYGIHAAMRRKYPTYRKNQSQYIDQKRATASSNIGGGRLHAADRGIDRY